MENKTINVKTIIFLAGAMIAFLIGAATATGQESMQFFSAHGFFGIGSIIIFITLLAWGGGSIIALGYREKDRIDSVYKYYLGNIIGTIFDWIVVIFIYGVVVTMLAGAGSVINETFGVSNYVGTIIIGVLVFLTIILSLNKILNILSPIGPLLIIFLAVISIISIYQNSEGFAHINESLNSVAVPSASGYWWLSGILYAAHAIIVVAPFFMRVGSGTPSLQSNKEASASGVSTALATAIPLFLMYLAVLVNIEVVFDKGAPLVFISQNIHPMLAVSYSVIILMGIYSTAAPMLWTVCDKIFSKDIVSKAMNYKVLAAILTAFAVVGGSFLPFGQLVGILYPITGYVGIILFLAIAFRQIIGKKEKVIQGSTENIH